MIKTKVTRGTDPEFSLVKGNQLISAIPYIQGTKAEPFPLKGGGIISWDNVACEFATPPASTTNDFIKKIKRTLKDTYSYIPKDMDLTALPSAEYPEEELQCEESRVFGCMPDMNAWSNSENAPPIPPTFNFRSFGGHVHVGCIKPDGKVIHKDSQFLLSTEGKILMIKGMDLFLGITSVILDNNKAAVERRKLYGKAGCFRATHYGVEYRTLSNFWLKTPATSMLISSLVDDVVESIVSGKLPNLIKEIGDQVIIDTINNGDVKKAISLFKKYISKEISQDSTTYYMMSLNELKKFTDLKSAWALTKKG